MFIPEVELQGSDTYPLDHVPLSLKKQIHIIQIFLDIVLMQSVSIDNVVCLGEERYSLGNFQSWTTAMILGGNALE